MVFTIQPLEPPVRQQPPPIQPPQPPPLKLKLRQFPLALKIAIGVIIGALLVGGVLLIFGKKSFIEKNVTLSIEAPKEAASGSEATFKIKYSNSNTTALSNVRITFTYPTESIVLKNGVVSKDLSEIISIDRIEANSSGEREFKAILVGPKGSIKTARVSMHFKPEELQTDLQKTAEGATTISTEPIAINVVVPPTILQHQTVTYLIDYRNESEEQFSSIRLSVRYPEGFTPSSIIPKPTRTRTSVDPSDTWDIKFLSPGDGERITIQGTIDGRIRETKTVTATLLKQIETSNGPLYVAFGKAENSSVVATPPLAAVVNLNEGRDYVAHLNDFLHYTIDVENTTDSDLTSLSVQATLDGVMYDTTTIQSNGSYDGRSRTILWNSAVVSELGMLRPHQKVTIPFSVRVKSAFPGSATNTKDSLVKATIHVETQNVPEIFHTNTLSADDALITRVTSAPTFAQRLQLQDPQFGSSDPFPPRVDQKTAFTVRWTLVNPSSELRPAKVTAVLLPGVTWENKIRLGGTGTEPTYDAKTSTITWNLTAVPPGIGMDFPAFEVWFQVSITPSENQIGTEPVLLKDIQFEAVDSTTGERISISQPSITTSSANGKGEVQ